MRATVGFAHDRHYSYTTRTSDGLGDEFGQDVFLILLRHCGNDVCERRLARKEVLFGKLAAKAVEVDIFWFIAWLLLALFMVFHEGIGTVGACAQVSFWFWRQFGELGVGHAFLFDRVGHRSSHSRHGCYNARVRSKALAGEMASSKCRD